MQQRRETREVRSYEATHGIVAEVLGRGVIRKLTYDVFRSARAMTMTTTRAAPAFLSTLAACAARGASGQNVVDQEHRATSQIGVGPCAECPVHDLAPLGSPSSASLGVATTRRNGRWTGRLSRRARL